MEAPKLITPPSVEPVSRDEVKLHCRIGGDEENAKIDAFITAARQAVECGESWSLERTLNTTTWRITLDRFPGLYPIELPRPPLIGITSITYRDPTGTEQTVDSSTYRVDADATPGRVLLAPNQFWPTTESQIGAIKITYTAGYGPTASDVPEAIRQAILMFVGDMYARRETLVTGTIVSPLPTVRALLNAFKWNYR